MLIWRGDGAGICVRCLPFPISYSLLPVTVVGACLCLLYPLARYKPARFSPFFLAVGNINSLITHRIALATHHTQERLVTFQLHFHPPNISSRRQFSTTTSHQPSQCSTQTPSSWPLLASLPPSPPHRAQQPLPLLLIRNLAAAPPLMRKTEPSSNRIEYKSNNPNSIITNCLASTGTRVSDCTDNDWKCLCDNQRAVLTCYDNCPSGM
jgi:hypothetical protein